MKPATPPPRLPSPTTSESVKSSEPIVPDFLLLTDPEHKVLRKKLFKISTSTKELTNVTDDQFDFYRQYTVQDENHLYTISYNTLCVHKYSNLINTGKVSKSRIATLNKRQGAGTATLYK